MAAKKPLRISDDLNDLNPIEFGDGDEIEADGIVNPNGDLTFEDSSNSQVTLSELVNSATNANCVIVGGSASNSANQSFNINLSGYGFKIGQAVRIGMAFIRGDFSSSNEYLNVGINSTGATKTRIGDDSEGGESGGHSYYLDDNIWRQSSSMVTQEYTIIDIGSGVAGVTVYVSPSSTVNFSPTGMPSGFWWQLAMDFNYVG